MREEKAYETEIETQKKKDSLIQTRTHTLTLTYSNTDCDRESGTSHKVFNQQLTAQMQ